MSDDVLLNLLNELKKSDNCEACGALNDFFTARIMGFIVEF